MLAESGFAVEAGKAIFSNLKVMNYRAPLGTFENLSDGQNYKGAFTAFLQNGLTVKNNAYMVNGGKSGSFVVVDPDRNAMPMLRTVFHADKKVAKACLYVTSRGAAD